VRIKATQLFSVKGMYQVKKVIEEHGLKFAKDELTKLREIIQDYSIVNVTLVSWVTGAT